MNKRFAQYSGESADLYEYDTADAGNEVLTLASSVTVDVVGFAQILGSTASGDGIVNQGVIVIDQTPGDGILSITPLAFTNSGTIEAGATTASESLLIESSTFTNSGTLDVAVGGTVNIQPITFTNSGTIDVDENGQAIIYATTFTNLSAHTRTGGTDEAQGGMLEIYGDDTITTDDANIILNGAGSTIETYNTSTGVYRNVDRTLTTIGSAGELQLLAGRDWTTAGAAITNDGIIQLGGGTLTSTASGASLTDAAGSTLSGFGTVTATTFANSGAIDASGGRLTLTDAVTGTGTDTISRASTLEFDAGVSSAKTFGDQDIDFSTGGGTLHLLAPRSFFGEISDFGPGDSVELTGSWAFFGISDVAGVTTLTLESGSTKHGFEFAGDYRRSDFSVTPGKTTTVGYA